MSMETQNTSAPKQTTAEETSKPQDEKASKARAAESGGVQTGRHSDIRCRKRTPYTFEDFNKPEDVLDTAILLMGLRHHDPHAQQDLYRRLDPKINSIAKEALQNGRLDILTVEDMKQELWAGVYKELTCRHLHSITGLKAFINKVLDHIKNDVLKHHILCQDTICPCGMVCDPGQDNYEDPDFIQGSDLEANILDTYNENSAVVLDPQDADMEEYTIDYYLTQFLQQADAETAYIIRARAREGKTNEDIARECGWPIASFYRKYAVATAKLKRFFEKHGWKEEHLYA